MGACLGGEERSRSNELDKIIKKDYNKSKAVAKLLLLGTGESGKSTILKQMKILHSGEKGFSEEEKLIQKRVIINNLLDSIESIIRAGIKFKTEWTKESNEAKDQIINYVENRETNEGTIDPSLVDKISTVWSDPAVKTILERRSEFQLLDSAPYFLNEVKRIADPNYMPTEADVLHARSITTGIITVPFQIDSLNLQLVDVGGQRSERRKWIHCFDNVTAVMFIISLSEYDQNLYEDETVNRMQESLTLFKQMLTSPFFQKIPFIIFFNKMDLFTEKLKYSKLENIFLDYQPSPNKGEKEIADEASAFIAEKFMEQSPNDGREVYRFFTTATDTNLVKNVFTVVKDVLQDRVLLDLGLT